MGDADFSGLFYALIILISISLFLVAFFLFKLLTKKQSNKNKRPPSIKKFFSISSITITILLFVIVLPNYTKMLLLIIALAILFPVYMYLLILLLMTSKGSNKARFIYIISIVLVTLGAILLLIEHAKNGYNPYQYSVIGMCFLILSGSIPLLFNKSSSAWFLESKTKKDNK